MRGSFRKTTRFIAGLVAAVFLPGAAASVCAEETTVFKIMSENEKAVYLTFDDGPDYVHTKSIMDTLLEHNVQGTFFFTGVNMQNCPSMAREIYDNGFSIGLHSYAHYSLAKMSPDGIKADLEKTNDVLESITGERSAIVRPPYGALNSSATKALEAFGYKAYMWTIDPRDWSTGTTDAAVIQTIKQNLEPGAIILLHSGANQGRAARILPELIEYIKSQGYQMKALPDPGYKTVPVSKSSVLIRINSTNASLEAYLIDGSNYINLRSFAEAVCSTEKRFNVIWDDTEKAVNLVTGEAYPNSWVINETNGVNTPVCAGRAKLSSSIVLIDGVPISLSAYTVNGGGFYSLRELAEALDLDFTFDAETNAIDFDIPVSPETAIYGFLLSLGGKVFGFISGSVAIITSFGAV